MGRGVTAGIAYAFAAFAVGFLIGTIRAVFIEPRLGPVAAVAVELPLMLGISWLIARTLIRHLQLGHTWIPRLEMGVAGLLVLVTLETFLGLLFGKSLAVQLAEYASTRGLLTLVGELGFALIPLFVQPEPATRSENDR